jgi:hypothetical protein
MRLKRKHIGSAHVSNVIHLSWNSTSAAAAKKATLTIVSVA